MKNKKELEEIKRLIQIRKTLSGTQIYNINIANNQLEIIHYAKGRLGLFTIKEAKHFI